MSAEETVKRIVTGIIYKLDIDFKHTTTFADLDANYLDVAEIIAELEDTYDIQITDEELQKFANMADLIACVERKIAEKG